MRLATLLPRRVRAVPSLVALLALAACHSGSRSAAAPTPSVSSTPSAHFTVGGTVSGLASGSSVTLSDNGTDTLTVSANGAFTFPTAITANGSYAVAVASQPQGETCAVTNGAGTGVTANVTTVSVVCSTQSFTVGGSVSGLQSGDQVVLQDSGTDSLTLAANGAFTFKTPLTYDSSYVVTVATQPAGEVCTVSNGSGAAMTADVTNVSVTCAAETFTLGGTVSGLASGGQLTLDDNGGDALTVTANGSFTFATPIAWGGSYSVTVATQPTGQVCTVSNGSGANVSTNISGVVVTCSSATFAVGGTLSGLASGAQVTLYDNGADPLTLTANGSFQFSTPVANGGSYAVTVATQPSGQWCTVSNGSGANLSADVTGVAVSCIDTQFTSTGSYTWTVPAGVTSIKVIATGGGGGGGGTSGTSAGSAGGAGAVVTSTLTVTPGQVLTLFVGGGGGAGTSAPSLTNGAGGGGGASSNIDAGAADQIIAGGGGGGGGNSPSASAGGNGGGANGAGGAGGSVSSTTGGSGGAGGIGGAGGTNSMMMSGVTGGSGPGGPGGNGGSNGGSAYPGGIGGGGNGAGTGGNDTSNDLAGGGGGGFGGGGSGVAGTGGGAGGSTGPTGSTFAPANNGGGSATAGGNGSIVITIL